MKKIIYSKFLRFIVWLLVIALTVPFVDVLYNGLNDYMELGGDSVYAFSRDFESSYYVSELLNMPINAVAFSYMDRRIGSVYTVHGNGSISAQHRSYTAVPVPSVAPSSEAPIVATPNPESTPEPTPTPATALSDEPTADYADVYEAFAANLSAFQRKFLAAILDGQDYAALSALAAEEFAFPEAIYEQLNDLAQTHIGDIILPPEGGEIYEEHQSALIRALEAI